MKAFLSTCLILALLFPEVASVVACKYASTFVESDLCIIDEGICYKHFFVGNLNGSSAEDILEMGCAANCPSTNYSFTILEGYLQSVIDCCQGDMCNDKDIDYPPRHYNGRTCPFYDASNRKGCPKLRNIRCSGDETRCIEFVLLHNNPSVPKKVYNGCATPSFCKFAKTSPFNDHLYGTITQARCGETLPP